VKTDIDLPIWARKILAILAFAAVALAGASCAQRSDAREASRIEPGSTPATLGAPADVDVVARIRKTD
jgi:hypothetical protein